MSEHEELTVDQALELLRQHHADGDDFGTDAAITIKRAQNMIAELRMERADLAEELSRTKKEVTDSEDRERRLRRDFAELRRRWADKQSFADLAASSGTVDAIEAARTAQAVPLDLDFIRQALEIARHRFNLMAEDDEITGVLKGVARTGAKGCSEALNHIAATGKTGA